MKNFASKGSGKDFPKIELRDIENGRRKRDRKNKLKSTPKVLS